MNQVTAPATYVSPDYIEKLLNDNADRLLSPLETLYCQYAKLMHVVYGDEGLLALPEHITESPDIVLSFVRNWTPWFPGETVFARENVMLNRIIGQHFQAQLSVLSGYTDAQKEELATITVRDALAVRYMLNDLRSGLVAPEGAFKGETVVCYSGGLDSVLATLMHIQRKPNHDLHLFHFNYAGPYSDKEENIAKDVEKLLVSYSSNLGRGSMFDAKIKASYASLIDRSIDEDLLVDGYIIPGRNGFIALTAAIMFPEVRRIVMTGHYRDEQGQNVGAVDKNFRFFSELQDILSLAYADDYRFFCMTMNVSKSDTLHWATSLPNQSELNKLLSSTTSCYHPTHMRCGECSSCFKRYRAMVDAGFTDIGYHITPTDSPNWETFTARESRKGR